MSGGDKRWLYGQGPLKELIERHPERIKRLYLAGEQPLGEAARAHRIACEIVDRPALDRLVGPGTRHQGAVAEVAPFNYVELDHVVDAIGDEIGLVLALDGITDPHNLGAILRSAYLFGAHGVILPKDQSAQVNAVVAKTSAGASELLPMARVPNLSRALDQLKEAGLWLVALDAGAEAQPLESIDLKVPIGLILGSEGDGIRRLVLSHADFRARLPMVRPAIGSFNVSVAAGAALYEVARQRR